MVMDVQDFWPEAAIVRGNVKNQYLIRFLLGLERFIYRRSSSLIALSDVMKTKIAARGVPAGRIRRVFNWADLSVTAKKTNQPLRTKHGLNSELVILFAGNMGVAQGLDTVVEAAALLRDDSSVRFVFLGDGVERSKLEKKVKASGLENVLFIDPVPSDQVMDYYSMADLLLVHLHDLPHRHAAVPSKLQGYMASGKPVLAGVRGATADLVEKANCGWIFEPDNAKSLADTVEKILSTSADTIQQLGASGQRFALANFELKQQCGKIEEALNVLFLNQEPS